MGFICEIFVKDYSGFYDLGITHPQTGENLFVGTHNCGAGADVLSESQLPVEMSDVIPWENFAGAANASIGNAVTPLVEQVFSAHRELLGNTTQELSDIMRSGNLSILEPNYIDVFYADQAAEIIGQLAGERAYMSSNPEESGVMNSIASDMMGVREGLNEIMESPNYSALLAVDHALADIGIEPEMVRGLNAMVAPVIQQESTPQNEQLIP
ncbi:MAG: hypothetical protein ACLFR0_01095 [Alphaproteobacteria bacterium]